MIAIFHYVYQDLSTEFTLVLLNPVCMLYKSRVSKLDNARLCLHGLISAVSRASEKVHSFERERFAPLLRQRFMLPAFYSKSARFLYITLRSIRK